MWYDYTDVQVSPRGDHPNGVPQTHSPKLTPRTLEIRNDTSRMRHSPVFLLNADGEAPESSYDPGFDPGAPVITPSWMARSSSRADVNPNRPESRTSAIDEEPDEPATHIKGIPKLQIIRSTPIESPMTPTVEVKTGQEEVKGDEDSPVESTKPLMVQIHELRESLWEVLIDPKDFRYVTSNILEAVFFSVYLALIVVTAIFAFLGYSPQTIGNLAASGIVMLFATGGVYSLQWLVAMIPYNGQSSSRCYTIASFGSVCLIGIHWAFLEDHWITEDNYKERECITGVVALGVFLFVWISGLAVTRNLFFRVSKYIHLFCVIGLFVSAYFHKSYFVLISLAFVAFDTVCRFLNAANNFVKIRSVSLKRLPADIVCLEMKNPENFSFKSGQHLCVCIPRISLFEWHPFGISSCPEDPTITLHARVVGRWTEALSKLAANPEIKESVTAFMLGPYGKPSILLWNPKRYSVFLAINAGIGAAALQTVCNSLMEEHHSGLRKVDKIFFCWTVRDSFKKVTKMQADPEFCDPARFRLPFSFQPDLLHVNDRRNKSLLRASYYLTKVRLVHDFHLGNINPATQKNLHLGRMHLSVEFEKAFKFCKAHKVKRTAVMVCAPAAMYDEVEFYCREWSRDGVSFDLHFEHYSY